VSIKKYQHSIIQFNKYLFVGGLNFIFTLCIYFFFLKILKVNYLISFSVACLLGVFLTYIINFLWVFKPEQALVFRTRLKKYFVVCLASYLFNLFLLKLLKERTGIDPFIIQLFILPMVIAINFLGMKYWSLKS